MTTAGSQRTALLVDDEEPLLRLMSRVLEKAGVRCLAAADADQARALFAEHAGDLDFLFLDVTLPGGDGAAELMPEFVEQRPTVRVVVTSGDEPPNELAEAMRKIGGQFLRKPFAPPQLLRLVEASASEVRSRSRSETAPTQGPS